MERKIDIFLLWVWFVTDRNLYEFDNNEQLALLDLYCQGKHWIEINRDTFKNRLRKDINLC